MPLPDRKAPQLITLRKPLQVDARRLAQAGNHAAIANVMISVPNPFTREDADVWIAAIRDRSGTDGYLIESNDDGSIVGAAELRDFDRQHRQAEVSFWLTPLVWGTGCAAAALTDITRIAFVEHGLNRIYAYHLARSGATGRVMMKCGFHLEARLRQWAWKDGRGEDAILWSRLVGDPEPSAEAAEKLPTPMDISPFLSRLS